jgi:hypothetical protein
VEVDLYPEVLLLFSKPGTYKLLIPAWIRGYSPTQAFCLYNDECEANDVISHHITAWDCESLTLSVTFAQTLFPEEIE